MNLKPLSKKHVIDESDIGILNFPVDPRPLTPKPDPVKAVKIGALLAAVFATTLFLFR